MHEIGRARDPAADDARRPAPEHRPRGCRRLARRAHGYGGRDSPWTRDPFDRLIAAQAIVADAPLVTADRTILEHLPLATWD